MKDAVDKDNLDNQKAQTLLQEFREIVGTDPIENEIKRQKQKEHYESIERTIKVKQNFEQSIETLNKQFFTLATSNELTPQQRGYKLEELFFELLRINEFQYSNPYKTNGEQIDGHCVLSDDVKNLSAKCFLVSLESLPPVAPSVF